MYVLRDVLCRWYVLNVTLSDNYVTFDTTSFIDCAMKFLLFKDALDFADYINYHTPSEVDVLYVDEKEFYPDTLKEFDNVYYSKNQ